MTSAALPLDRVVHVASGREWRGGERQVLLLARGLKALGLDQIVVTRGHGRLAAELTRAGIPIHPVGWSIAVSPGALIATLREGTRGRCLLHAHDGHAVTVAGAAAQLGGRPFVATRRTDFPLRRRGYWSRAGRVIAISSAVRDRLVAGGIASDRIAVVPSGVEPPLNAPRVDPASPMIVAIGALTPEKGHAVLLEAAALLKPQFPNLRWQLAGDGPLRATLEARAAELGLGAEVVFRGELEDPRILLSEASLFVSASSHEGLGTAVLDAMAAGVAVVATAVGGIPEVLAGGAGVMVDQGNPEALAAGVAALLRDETTRRNVTLMAAERVRSFTVERMATAVVSVYRSVVSSP